jgi:hypothetical protein
MSAYSPWRIAALIRSASREVTMSRGILCVGPTLWISCEARLNEADRRGHSRLAPRLLHPLVGQPRGPTTACSVMGGVPYRGNYDVPPTTGRLATHSGIVRPSSSRSKSFLTHPRAARALVLPGAAVRTSGSTMQRCCVPIPPRFVMACDHWTARDDTRDPTSVTRVSAVSAQHGA